MRHKITKEDLAEKFDLSEFDDLPPEFWDIITDKLNKPVYNRILSESERKMISTAAFGHLIKLHSGGFIDRFEFERILALSFGLSNIVQKQITQNMMKQITDMTLLNGTIELSVKEILNNLNNPPSSIIVT